MCNCTCTLNAIVFVSVPGTIESDQGECPDSNVVVEWFDWPCIECIFVVDYPVTECSVCMYSIHVHVHVHVHIRYTCNSHAPARIDASLMYIVCHCYIWVCTHVGMYRSAQEDGEEKKVEKDSVIQLLEAEVHLHVHVHVCYTLHVRLPLSCMLSGGCPPRTGVWPAGGAAVLLVCHCSPPGAAGGEWEAQREGSAQAHCGEEQPAHQGQSVCTCTLYSMYVHVHCTVCTCMYMVSL